VFHVHDWQTAAIPVYLNTLYRGHPVLGQAATVLTIHNMQHQGRASTKAHGASSEWAGSTSITWTSSATAGPTAQGGLYHATLLNAVSPTYAREIQTAEFGYGLEGVVRDRAADLRGSSNGIDYERWNPETTASWQPATPKSRSAARRPAGRPPEVRRASRAQRRALIGLVTRLVGQKGSTCSRRPSAGSWSSTSRSVLLGSGEVWAHFFFGGLPSEYPDQFACYIGFDNALAHKIEAGADFFLMPSRFEPCGLNQMFSLRYGRSRSCATWATQRHGGELRPEHRRGDRLQVPRLTPDALANTVSWPWTRTDRRRSSRN